MKTTRLMMVLLIAIATAFTSCETDGEDGMDGMDGAPGIQGPAGQDGQDGQDGTDGQDGEDGNANVISSGWVEYVLETWGEVENLFGNDVRTYPVSVPELSEEVAADGFVMVYTRFTITNTPAYAMPFTENITGAGGGAQEMYFQFEPENLFIRLRNVGGVDDPGTFGGPGIAEFRYIIIPSNAGGRNLTSSAAIEAYYKSIGLDLYDYKAVIDHFNLDE